MRDKVAEGLHLAVVDATSDLAGSEQIPASFAVTVDRIVDAVLGLTPTEEQQVDAYLLRSLRNGLIRAQRADGSRREARIALEQIRVALRDLAEQAPVAPTADAKDLARWLDATLADLRDDEVADLLGVSRRTWQRWTSESGGAPGHDDAIRLRDVARAVAHLRFTFSGAGAAAWLQRPHPALGGQTPLELLTDPATAHEAVRAAATARATVAA